ncbi:arginase [Coprococcus eutactus]|uniref:Arginase n=1 Tax=Coprococcus eutactus TaxID=33043 RepID=A0A3R6ARD2_9FIRM|nr:arginase [Coprococcus eutactus]
MGDNRVKNENLILDFTHVYCDEYIKDIDRFRYMDCSDIEETDMYCSKNAYEKIWGRIEPYGIQGIHYIDSGNYHYITKIITDHITEPFGLVMYDHHTDMQIPMVPEMMSCGDWAGQTLSQNKNLRQLVIVGPPESDIEQTLESYSGSQSGRLLTFSAEDLHGDLLENKLKLIRTDLPLYISIDKDVLGTEYTETNWSQGDMSIDGLERLLGVFLGGQGEEKNSDACRNDERNAGDIRHSRILGIDICGEIQTDIPVPEYLEAEEKNEKVNIELFRFISEHVKKFR